MTNELELRRNIQNVLTQELELSKSQNTEQIQEIERLTQELERIRNQNSVLIQELQQTRNYFSNELNEAQRNYTRMNLNNVGHVFNVHQFPYIDAYNFPCINLEESNQFNVIREWDNQDSDEHINHLTEQSSSEPNSHNFPNNTSMTVSHN